LTDQHVHRTVGLQAAARRRELLKDGPGRRVVVDPLDAAQPKADVLQPPRGIVHGAAPEMGHDPGSLADPQLNDGPRRQAVSGNRILREHDADRGTGVLLGPRDDDAEVQRHHHSRRLRHGFADQIRHLRMRPQVEVALGRGYHDHGGGDDRGGGSDARGPPPGKQRSERPPAGGGEHGDGRFLLPHASLLNAA
jgi:hypothetical protein